MKTLRVCLAVGWFACAAAVGVRADDNLRHYQESLRDQGFYYGPVNGSSGDETTQAIRRYQIRNGLAVTGQLDDATRRAIDKSAAETREPAQSTPPPLVTPAPTPTRRASTPDPSPAYRQPATPRPSVPPVNDGQDDGDNRPATRGPGGGGGVAPSAALSAFFQDSPYEFAPPPVQADVLHRVQTFLARNGFYDGPEDGRPNADFAEALSNFQEVNHIRRTSRLDPSTLAVLRMLPPRRYHQSRGGDPDDNRSGGAPVYEGRVVH